uniref:Ycf15 n=1 Tax=Romanomermis culicivorax TaxID=13658 RepID=A0A915I1T8_ROMCU
MVLLGETDRSFVKRDFSGIISKESLLVGSATSTAYFLWEIGSGGFIPHLKLGPCTLMTSGMFLKDKNW